MNTKNNRERSAQHEPRLAGEILHNYFENSNEPLAVAYRKHKAKKGVEPVQLFNGVYPDTHLCVDLKLLTRKQGHVSVGTCLSGVLKRDAERHFCFLENDSKKKGVCAQRNPHLFRGTYVNVKKRCNGALYLTLNGLNYKRGFSFQDYCQGVAKEVLLIANLFDK